MIFLLIFYAAYHGWQRKSKDKKVMRFFPLLNTVYKIILA